jgi:hypothetical protein
LEEESSTNDHTDSCWEEPIVVEEAEDIDDLLHDPLLRSIKEEYDKSLLKLAEEKNKELEEALSRVRAMTKQNTYDMRKIKVLMRYFPRITALMKRIMIWKMSYQLKRRLKRR